MYMDEPRYNLLLVSAIASFTTAVTDLLSKEKYNPVHVAASIQSAKQEFHKNNYDFIIIHSPLPDDTGIRFAMETVSSSHTVVLLIVKSTLYTSIHNKVTKYGVFTLSRPMQKPTLIHALDWMESAREYLRQSEKKSLSLEEQIAELHLINRAKWILIRELHMEEADAHRYIEKQAMDCCLQKKIIAEHIVNSYTKASL